MPHHDLSRVGTWVFDLDNTLYPKSARLFDQIEVRMTAYVMQALGVDQDEANHLRDLYWRRFGTTLAGLMTLHDVDPLPYMETVHDISLEHLNEDANLISHIGAYQGRRIVFTNGPRSHADRVLAARGLTDLFHAVYGVEHADYRPKPERAAFERVFALDGLDPRDAVMFEDDPRNLEAPYEMGMRTVLVHERSDLPHIQHQTDDLTAFLSQVVG